MEAGGKTQGFEFSKGRLEAFSDGVIAIAITLLVLDLNSPEPINGSLIRGLLHEWPSFAAYFVSFLAIGIFWINHHQFFQHIKRVDYPLLMFNLLLLMWVSLWPFTTKVLAEHLGGGASHEQGAAVIYVCGYLALGLSWAATYWHVRRADLLDIVPSPEHERYLKHRNFFGMMGYTVSLVVAFFSAGAALVLCTGVLVYYATPAREDVVEPGTRPL